jgi:transposase
MRAYSMDLRERVFADCQAGMATPAVAAKYRVSQSWVRRLKQRQKATGSLAPRPHSPGRPVVLAAHDARVRELVRDDPDATLAELRDRLGVRVSISALSEYLRRIELSFKKKSSGPPSRTART